MDPSQVSVYFPIANSSTNDARRRVRYDIESPGGWQKHIDTQIRPILDAGVTTIELHNPGGVASSDMFMRFDQFELAKKAGLDFVNDFVDAFKPITDSGVRVIGYLGCPDDIPILWDTDGSIDDDMELDADDAWAKRSPSIMGEVRKYILDGYKAFRDAGVCVGFDRSSNQSIDSMTAYCCASEQLAGRQSIVEATARKESPWMWGYDQLCLYRTFRPRHIEGTHPTYQVRFPQLGQGAWYKGTTFVLFRTTVVFTQGELKGQRVQLWRDVRPMVEWWNQLRALDPASPIVPMMSTYVFNKLMEDDLMKELAD